MYGVSARVVVRYKRLCGCRVSSLDDEEGMRKASSLGRSRQGSAPLDQHYQPLTSGAASGGGIGNGGNGGNGGGNGGNSGGGGYGTSGDTAPLNVPNVVPRFPDDEDAATCSPRSYSDQSVFHRSTHGLILGKERGRL